MANSEGITIEDVAGYEYLGTYNNNWRCRTVRLYAHPSDPAKVVSVGMPTSGSTRQPIVCVEFRADYARQLIHGDWSDYN